MTAPQMTLDDLKRLMAEATPGPWQPGELLSCMIYNWHVAPDHPEAVIAEAYSEANASLIAAAPDLAAQVIKLTEALARIDALEGQSMPLDPFLEAKAIARAALEARK